MVHPRCGYHVVCEWFQPELLGPLRQHAVRNRWKVRSSLYLAELDV